MAAAVLRDEDFPPDLERLTFNLCPLANDGAWLMSGKRTAAAAFLDSMLPQAGAAKAALEQAAALYREQATVWGKAGHLIGWSGASDEQKLALVDRGLREQFAVLVQQAKELEEKAVAHLEEAVALTA